MVRYACIILSLIAGSCALGQQMPTGLALPHTAAVRDTLVFPEPAQVRIEGLLGWRYNISERNRLMTISESDLLSGFQHRPGSQAWIGEHVGKWLHAASIVWAATKDPKLRAKLDRVASELMDTQGPDGYLGTYVPNERFGLYPGADWDVWVNRYCLTGLLTYYQYTGNRRALQCCEKIGDLLLRTFGHGRKSILSAGTQDGMASTSALAPMLMLYRATGAKRYLQFAKYIVSSWDEPGGPRILNKLLQGSPVNEIGNAKAYEMELNLNGLCELYRVTGDRQYLDAALNAWRDIRDNRLYITGSGSIRELWGGNHDLPNNQGDNICETCVTVTWMQFNMQLLRLTGEAKFADELEKTIYNHLLAAQSPLGSDWCYYTSLDGFKPYDSAMTCCHSSGPRGIALIPLTAYGKESSGLVVNLCAPSTYKTAMGSGMVALSQSTDYPLSGKVILNVKCQGARLLFSLKLRKPAWCEGMDVRLNGKRLTANIRNGYWVITRRWGTEDKLAISFPLTGEIVEGQYGNTGDVAVRYGPLVLAYDQGLNNDIPPARTAIAPPAIFKNHLYPIKLEPKGGWKNPTFSIPGEELTAKGVHHAALNFTPFYSAGSTGKMYRIWMRTPAALKMQRISLLSGGEASRSRVGNRTGDIRYPAPGVFVVTFDGAKRESDWYAIQMKSPVTIREIQFTQGGIFHDGGWFDTTDGKPLIQIQKELNGKWINLATLSDYPTTTATSYGDLKEGEKFNVVFPPLRIFGVRVTGRPACGDNPNQSFSSCEGIEGFN